MTSRKCRSKLGDAVDRRLLRDRILVLDRMHDEVGVLVQEAAVLDGHAGELADHLGGERPAEIGDEIRRPLRREPVDQLRAHRVDERLQRADTRWAQHRGEDLPDLGVPGRVRLTELQLVGRAGVLLERRERRLREPLRVAADLDDVLVAGDVEDARHDLDDRRLVTQLREDLFVVVDLVGIERVVGDRHDAS